jgi:hypothetical protein
MKEEIENLAYDIELEGIKFDEFMIEMEEKTRHLSETEADFNKMYKIADKVMVKYM